MAGKGIVFILALFVVIQSMHALVNLNYECPSTFSLKVGYDCCENLEKVNVCVERTSVTSAHNSDEPARSLSESTDKSNKTTTFVSKSSNNSDEATRVVQETSKKSNEAATVVPESSDSHDETC